MLLTRESMVQIHHYIASEIVSKFVLGKVFTIMNYVASKEMSYIPPNYVM